MIFACAGTQLPFDRFIETLDHIAPDIDEEIVVQAIPGAYQPQNFTLHPTIPHDEFCRFMEQSRLVVSHAGMGTILTSLHMSKPIVIFPRYGSLGEHRNDHQIATAKQFEGFGYVYVAYEEDELRKHMLNADIAPLHTEGPHASPQLVGYVDAFVVRHH